MKKIFLLVLITFVYGVAYSQEESNCEIEGENGEIITCRYDEEEDEEEEEFCGLETKFKEGQLYSLKSCACGDWVGKYKKRKRRLARRKAELRANRAISEFMQTKLKSSSFLKELSDSLEKECLDQEEAPNYCPQDPDSVSEDGSAPPPEEGGSVDEYAETMSQSIEQSSEQILSGIRKIANGPTDKEEKSACVWMGWSLKTNKAAGQLRKEMDKNIKKDKKVKIKEKPRRKSNDTAGSKSKDFDDF